MLKSKLQYITLRDKNISDFAEARNGALRNVKTEWVFFVDSDELVSAQLKDEVETAIANKNINGYFVYRKNYFLDKYIGTDKVLRLAKKNSGKWTRKVHETWEIKGKIGILNSPLIHKTTKNLSEYIDKINFYSKLHSQANMSEGKNSSVYKIFLFPLIQFIRSIFLGRGIVFSIMQSLHSFLSWSEIWLTKNK